MHRVVSTALLVVLLCPVISGIAEARPSRERVAVLELANPAGLTVQEKDYLTNLVRSAARKSLASGRFVIMTRENIFDLLGDQMVADCIGDCAVETGRNLGAAYVVAGEVLQFGHSLRINLTLHETDSGNLLATVQAGGASVEDLEAPVAERGLELFRPLRSWSAENGDGREMTLGGGGSVWSATAAADVVVRFESEPAGAMVEVDGMPLCETPCSRPLTPGTKDVAFKLLRYVPASRLVEVAEGMDAVRETLKPNFGWLSVVSEPSGLDVEVDGESFGETPVKRLEIGLGMHEVWVRGATWQDVGERIVVEHGEDQEVRLAPLPINGGLKVQAVDRDGNAVDGEVLVDGRVVGRTWAPVTVQAGEHEVGVKRESRTWRVTLAVPAESLLLLNAEAGDTHELRVLDTGIVSGVRDVRRPKVDNVEIPVVLIEPGEFWQGSRPHETGRDADELRHSVQLTRRFLLGKTEVTQGQYEAVMGKNPSYFKGEDLPVERVNWFDSVEFCNRLSQQEGLRPAYRISDQKVIWDKTADGYRLPTEAEWEYACRAGTVDRFHTGNRDSDLRKTGWYIDNSDSLTHVVGQKLENGWGLEDMHGNVWEWCWDWYGQYPPNAEVEPTGPARGSRRVLRGGSWRSDSRFCRSANRCTYDAVNRGNSFGFRVARSVNDEQNRVRRGDHFPVREILLKKH